MVTASHMVLHRMTYSNLRIQVAESMKIPLHRTRVTQRRVCLYQSLSVHVLTYFIFSKTDETDVGIA